MNIIPETFAPSVIWRHEIPIRFGVMITDTCESARPLRVAIDDRTPPEHLSMWMLRPDEKTPPGSCRARTFVVFGTGRAIPERHRYVGSASGGPFVWHVFEKIS